jgi:hypothetical protein
MSKSSFPSPAVALEELLGGVARGLAGAQRELDRAAVEGNDLWFVFGRTTLDIEFSTFVGDGAQFRCRPLDPVAAALRGGTAAGTRLRVELAPLGSDLLRSPDRE